MPRQPASYVREAVELGRQIRALREARGWSQYELAAQVDPPLSRQQIHLIEHGRSGGRDADGHRPSNPRLATLIAICEVLQARVVIDVSRPTGFVVEVEGVR